MLKDKIWKIKEKNSTIVNTIAKENNVSPIIATILANRGFTEQQQINNFLNPTKDRFHDPFLLKDMDKAVERIIKARELREKIIIYGDYDVDGITSTSVLSLFLEEIGCIVDYYIPDRHSEGYGINCDALSTIKAQGADIVISVDTGITAVKESEHGKAIGLDMIITDHHECQEQVPNAYCVINPKQKDCQYPFDMLAGCGVTFKLIHGIAIKCQQVERIWKYLDIVAIGTIADIVPLIDENRIITKIAFATMYDTWNYGLKALLDVAKVKKDAISAGTIGFQIGPRLNAAGRLGDAKRGVKLFRTKDKQEAVSLSEELDAENQMRQEIERTIFKEADQLIQETMDIEHTKILVVHGKEWNHGVIGIVASRITEKYYRPTILLTEEDGIASGSARSVEGFSIFEALCSCKDLFEKFGGHDMAAGMSLKAENVERLRIRLNEFAEKVMQKDTLVPKISADMPLDINTVNVKLIKEIAQLEPYGVGNEEPKFICTSTLKRAQLIGKEKNHLKLSINRREEPMDCIGFNFGDYYDYLVEDYEIKVVGTLTINEWNNKQKPQIMLKDIQYSDKLTSTLNQGIKLAWEGQEAALLTLKDMGKVPSRQDFEWTYRLFLGLNERKKRNIPLVKLLYFIEEEKKTHLTKVLLCLRVFKELELIDCKINANQLTFHLTKGKKVELSDSTLYNKLC